MTDTSGGFQVGATYTGTTAGGFPGSSTNTLTQGNAPGLPKGSVTYTVDMSGIPGVTADQSVMVPVPLQPGQMGPPTFISESPQPLKPGQMGPPTYGTTPQSATMNLNQALNLFFSWTPTQMQQMSGLLYDGGFYSTSIYDSSKRVIRPADVYDAYKAALLQAAYLKTSLTETLRNGAGQFGALGTGGAGGPGGAGAGSGGGGVRVYPGGKVAVTQTDPQTIRDAADATYQKLLGRDATDKEAQAVVNQVRGQEDTRGRQQAALDESSRQAQIQSNEALYGNPATATVGGQPAGASDVVAAITQAAQAAGVPPALALAIAQHESGMNPQAVGDQGTSFGLYQLHQGGELGSMSKQQAFDPYTNATRALAEVAAVMKQHPDWSPGQIAAAAQRPANQAAYAAAINSLLQGQGVSVQGTTPGGSTGQSTDVFLAPTVQDISTPITPQGAATQQIQTQNVPEMQEYGAQRQIINFTQALHSMPGDTGAANAKPVAP